MNIHFTDKELFDTLLNATLVKTEMGSFLYGLKDKNSDTDYLCIYAPAKNENNSFSFTHHQLQYKDTENNIDYIFVNIFNFIRNALNGDSTINIEVIHNEELINTSLSFLYDMRFSFHNYAVMRSYLGLARRDLKHVEKQDNNRNKNKRLIHAYRGFIFARNMIYGNFNIKLSDLEMNEVNLIRKFTSYKERKNKIDELNSKIDSERKILNTKLDKGELIRFMKVDHQFKLDYHLSELIESDLFKSKVTDEIDLNLIYEANENGINY